MRRECSSAFCTAASFSSSRATFVWKKARRSDKVTSPCLTRDMKCRISRIVSPDSLKHPMRSMASRSRSEKMR